MPPRPIKTFPAPLPRVLRFLLPNKRPEDRMKIYREFVRGSLYGNKGVPPTDDEVTEAINEVASEGIKTKEHVERLADWIHNVFLPWYTAKNLKKRAKAGAEARWEKWRAKKRKEQNPP